MMSVTFLSSSRRLFVQRNGFIRSNCEVNYKKKYVFGRDKYMGGNLTFVCPCLASMSLNDIQQDATFPRSIYFYKLLYMFHAVAPPIIRSTKLYIQRQVLSNQYCCLLLSWMRWNVRSILSTIAAGSSIGLTIPDAVCTVLCS